MHKLRRPTWMRHAALTALGALLIPLLAACGGRTTAQNPTSPPAVTTVSTSAPAVTTAATSAPATTAVATSAPMITTVPATTTSAPTSAPAVTATSAPVTTTAPATTAPAPVTASPASTAVDAIKAVIQRANQEQQQAFAAQNPTLMRDTATTTYYNQLAQGFVDLQRASVTAIHLVNLTWGPITLQGATAAQATTAENWRTTFADGSTVQETDTNVYTMVLQNGAWKVQDDQHPDTRQMQPPPGAATAGPSPGTAPTPVGTIAPAGAGQSHSRNWAGYAATGGTFTAVSGTWTVPNVSAGRTPAADATWVGIGGVTSTDLIQAGTDATVQGGQVSYTAWVETLPRASQTVPLSISAGDKVSVSITQQPDGRWQILIRDATTGQSYQNNVAYASSRSSAEWVEESPSAGRRVLLPLDNFGTVTFTGATTVENGRQRSIKQAKGQAITMLNTSAQALARPSALGTDGASFSVTRTNAPATRIGPGRRSVP